LNQRFVFSSAINCGSTILKILRIFFLISSSFPVGFIAWMNRSLIFSFFESSLESPNASSARVSAAIIRVFFVRVLSSRMEMSWLI
jgi:hypothetical protein